MVCCGCQAAPAACRGHQMVCCGCQAAPAACRDTEWCAVVVRLLLLRAGDTKWCAVVARLLLLRAGTPNGVLWLSGCSCCVPGHQMVCCGCQAALAACRDTKWCAVVARLLLLRAGTSGGTAGGTAGCCLLVAKRGSRTRAQQNCYMCATVAAIVLRMILFTSDAQGISLMVLQSCRRCPAEACGTCGPCSALMSAACLLCIFIRVSKHLTVFAF
ncbi:hypothetical protein COO60DRAFT_716271 [Scenedesmus sp. NREL 46B-D3]|nr:hypothetical protein COO60DRAFT_716271 [Scenedesmus sp. NREL 46B-D3]